MVQEQLLLYTLGCKQTYYFISYADGMTHELDLDLDFQSPASNVHGQCTCKISLSSKVSWLKSWSGNRRTDRRTRPIALYLPATFSL